MAVEKIRLQKYLSQCSVTSRRGAEELIEQGKVKINGRTAILGDKVDPVHDKVLVSGKPVTTSDKKMYIMLHKPRGFVTTLSDEQGRKCVADLVADAGVRLFPVGRLDRNSEGLLFMTNDGEFANMLTHPSRHVSKVYRVTVREKPNDMQLARMEDGIVIEGQKTLPCEAFVIERYDDRTVLRFVLYEGRNREIRKLCEAVGLTVIRLKRVEMAGIKLGMLPQGRWRELDEKEVKKLMSVSIAKEFQENDRDTSNSRKR
jgi:23S rRNA pseudouridine2605 synthase